MEPNNLSSIAKLLIISCLCMAFLSCQKDEAYENVTPNPDPLGAEKALQWKYSATGSNRASFLLNGVHKNISGVREAILDNNFSIHIDRMPNTKNEYNIPFWLVLQLDTSANMKLRRTFSFGNNINAKYNDTTFYIPIRTGFKDATCNIAGLFENFMPNLQLINTPQGINTSDGYGHGWLKINTYS